MRAAAAAVTDAGVDAWASERLGAARAERLRALAADPGVPPFFGRTDTVPIDGPAETFHIGRRHVRDAAGRPGRHRLAGADEPAVLPGQRRRSAGSGPAPPVRLRRRRADRLRGRAPGAPATSTTSEFLRGRDRASAQRPDARHRRHHPARPGRHRARPAEPSRSACRGRRAPARPRSGCTAPPTCSTRTAGSWPAPASSSSGPTARSSATSSRCCPPSARSTSTRRRSPT